MKKTFTLLLMALILGLCTVLKAQTALDPGMFVNQQITGPGVYTVEAGTAYAFDGTINLDYEITIQGPDNGWMMDAEDAPILIQSPAADGSGRSFFEIIEGGGITMKNLVWSGMMNNSEVVKTFAQNTSGNRIVVDNCVISDWEDFSLRNRNQNADSVAVTNSIFINGLRRRFSQWGGFPIRLDVAANNVVFENNTVVNSGRLLCNSGPFHNATIHQIHNTYLNQVVAGEEQRANEFITANNIFHNYHFIGHRNEGHSNGQEEDYGAYWTTWNYFADSKEKLDSISLYLGQNLFYRPQEVTDFFEEYSDSLSASLLWERPDVDSFIVTDDNYRIGANYSNIDPGFTMHPGNIDQTVEYVRLNYTDPCATCWPDWRIAGAVSYADGSAVPNLNWPPPFDLSYSNASMQVAGTDGLPLGDLNWFPDKLTDYNTNRDAYIADLRDSMINAVVYYDPETMDETPLITELPSSVFDQQLPDDLYLTGNYPNPFDERTTIKFGLHKQSDVRLSVFNLVGQRVVASPEQRFFAGPNEISFDANNLSSGVYLYKIDVTDASGETYVLTKEMIITK